MAYKTIIRVSVPNLKSFRPMKTELQIKEVGEFSIMLYGKIGWGRSLAHQHGCGNINVFSKSVLNIRTRLVVTVKPETKWMPNSDSALKLVPKCKILCQYDLLNYFYSCLKIAVF